jgi:hypothetical protein
VRPFPLLAVLALLVATFAASCRSGDDGPDFPEVITVGKGDLFPGIINSGLGVGQNRVSMQLIDRDDNVLLDAKLRVRYFNLNSDKPRLVSESAARLITSELAFIDENHDFERTVTGTGGAYVTYATFDEPGTWGAEITIERAGKTTVVPYRFNVLEKSIEPAIGDAAPASVQATTASEPLAEIDSSFPPRLAMHTTTVADALRSGKPIVIAFATPAFCTSRTCAPVMDNVMDPLFQQYRDRAVFIHIEPYVLRDLRTANARNPVPAFLEWRLESEPWIFVVGGDGRIRARFEGIVALDEVQSVLDLALDEGAAVTPASP